MMLKTYKEELLIKTSNCDMTGHWKPSDIMIEMQELAGIHSELLGCGRTETLKSNAVWVLTRSETHMNRYPVIGERVACETFPVAPRRMFFPRYYVFRDENGDMLGASVSYWVLLDVTTRKMVNLPDVVKFLPDNADLPRPIGLPSTVEEIDGVKTHMLRTPVYSDLDVNGHVNNTRYADWLCDMLGIDVMKNKTIRTLVVNYHHEVLPEQDMSLTLSLNDEAFSLSGRHNDLLHFEVGGTFMI